MERIEALKLIAREYYGNKLINKLSEPEFDEVVAFIEDHSNLNYLEFEYSVNRMHLDLEKKPKHWAIIQELLISANTRSMRG